jgi:uncharacterized membrane protein
MTLKTPIIVKEQIVVRKDMDLNVHERLSNMTLKTPIIVKEQIVVRKDMDLNVQIGVILDSLSCTFKSISFLTTICSFTIIGV